MGEEEALQNTTCHCNPAPVQQNQEDDRQTHTLDRGFSLVQQNQEDLEAHQSPHGTERNGDSPVPAHQSREDMAQ